MIASMTFACFVIQVDGDIDEMHGFRTETEADAFGRETSGYGLLDSVMDDPNHWAKYDPPMVFVLDGSDASDTWEAGKWERPVAIYMRGEKWACVKQE